MVFCPNKTSTNPSAQQPAPQQAPTKLNCAIGVDRELLLTIAQDLTDHAQSLAASVQARLETPLNETSEESQDNTQQLLDWVADLYAIGSEINTYLNPEVEAK